MEEDGPQPDRNLLPLELEERLWSLNHWSAGMGREASELRTTCAYNYVVLVSDVPTRS